MNEWVQFAPVREIEASRTKRKRESAAPSWPLKPLALSWEERALLTEWVRGKSGSRRWEKLRELAGISRLDLADRLWPKLLSFGAFRVSEVFRRARWELVEITWADLHTLQIELGVTTQAQHASEKLSVVNCLTELSLDESVGEVASVVLQSPLATKIKQSRAELLVSLRDWIRSERKGKRQDFALFSRPHTKAISSSEWAWLEQSFDLIACGIDRFLPLVWLAGTASLQWGTQRIDLSGQPFVALSSEALGKVTQVDRPPQSYWLIENRASFEKQASSLDAACCLIWTAGRPSNAWLQAMQCLLAVAPAPVFVSADLDPAGLEIALACTEPWRLAGLPWTTKCMDADMLANAKLLPLNLFDQQSIERLKVHPEISSELLKLVEEISVRQGKAEQEAWL